MDLGNSKENEISKDTVANNLLWNSIFSPNKKEVTICENVFRLKKSKIQMSIEKFIFLPKMGNKD